MRPDLRVTIVARAEFIINHRGPLMGNVSHARRAPRWRMTLLAVVIAAFGFAALTATSAQAGDGFFCGTGSSPITMVPGGQCIGSAYHSNFGWISANNPTGNHACAALSTTPGSVGLTIANGGSSIVCSGGATYANVWICPGTGTCGGYGAIWKRSAGSGTYYGTYQWN